MLGLDVLFYFLLFLCQRKLKFGMVVSLLVAQYVQCLAVLVLICLG